MTSIHRDLKKLLLAVLLLACGLLASAAPASATAEGPAWEIDALANSTAPPGGQLTYLVEIRNGGNVDLDGSAEPISFTGTLPAGLTIKSVKPASELDCSGLVPGSQTFTCHYTGLITTQAHSVSNNTRAFVVNATVAPGASGVLTATFHVAGGEPADGDPSTPSAGTVAPATITPASPSFGIAAFDAQVLGDASGTPFTQAGGHPFAATTWIDFNTLKNPDPLKGNLRPVEAPKDVEVDLPAGFSGDPSGVSQCTLPQLSKAELGKSRPLCPATSQVGTTSIHLSTGGRLVFGPFPVYNMVPPATAPVRLGFNVLGTVVVLDANVRTAGDYGITAKALDIGEGIGIAGSSVTLWGVPADPVHDPERACPGESAPWQGGPSCSSGAPRTAFLRNPTSCPPPGVGLATTVRTDSWVHPGVFREQTITSHLPNGYPFPPEAWGPQAGTTGCEQVPFDPTVAAAPDSTVAGQPSGLSFDLSLPQSSDPSVIGQGDLKKAVVTLPQGLRVSPSSASGLQGCSPSQVALHSTTPVGCPDGSKLGAVSVKTPALPEPLQGSLYLATPHENPFGSLLALYLVAEGSGVTVKLAGRVDADPVTGQLTTTFDNNPQLPFSKLHLQLKGGPRAPLVTPPTCGTYTTHSELTSWSGAVVSTDSPFGLTQSSTGGPCAPLGFSPGFTAGTENPLAGAYSPFTLRLQRSDQDGEFSSLSPLNLPPGLLADVSSVKERCTDAQAAAASCPAASHIGEVTVGAGAGPNPFYVGGDVYLTTPYKGNPFGLAIIVHAAAGPFDLGYVVVRGGIQIHDDASVTAVTDPLPRILQGIPLQVRDIRVNLDRPNFIISPTSCAAMGISASAQSTIGQNANLSSRFQVGECARLAFKPSFTVSASGKTSKANGASLHVHLATNEGPAAAVRETNIAKVDVQLPVMLPSRLTTLQKACTAAQFEANPAGCPEGSFVGTAIAHTPDLPSALSGPAILVSHGGQAFPDLVLVLQGEGVRINLTGHTQIKKGITYSHFDTVPDAPVSSFDLTLPQGPHSVLAAVGNLCANTKTVSTKKRVTRRVNGHPRKVTINVKRTVASPLLMPTTMTAQNGAVLQQNTKIAVTGCPTAKSAKHAHRATARRRRG